jgi:hypothetical protein
MPSHHLIRQYADLGEIERKWPFERHEIERALRKVPGGVADAAGRACHRSLFGYAAAANGASATTG